MANRLETMSIQHCYALDCFIYMKTSIPRGLSALFAWMAPTIRTRMLTRGANTNGCSSRSHVTPFTGTKSFSTPLACKRRLRSFNSRVESTVIVINSMLQSIFKWNAEPTSAENNSVPGRIESWGRMSIIIKATTKR